VTRTWQHKLEVVPGFTKQHDIDKLVWYEIHESALAARTREEQIKKWNRAWKVNLIQTMNPTWRDLYLDFTA
jgi:putative endonuclease